jgi:hypothetical protein
VNTADAVSPCAGGLYGYREVINSGDVRCLLRRAVVQLRKIVCHCGVAGWHTLHSEGIHSGDLENEET